MLKNLKLARPLAIIDLETTGVDVKTDRIVEISVMKVYPDGNHIQFTQRINPGISIPAEATAIHGITDDDVANCPRFCEPEILLALEKLFDNADLAGFNIRRFDLRILMNEFGRAAVRFSLEGRKLIDVLEIYHKHNPRDLTAAVRHYLGREHDGAHGAAADVLATAQILDAQVERYDDVPATVPELHALYTDPAAVDFDGKLRREPDGRIVLTFGKHLGRDLAELADAKPDYLQWMLSGDFFSDTKDYVRRALKGERFAVGLSDPVLSR